MTHKAAKKKEKDSNAFAPVKLQTEGPTGRLDTVATVSQQWGFNSNSDSVTTVLRQYNDIETVKKSAI